VTVQQPGHRSRALGHRWALILFALIAGSILFAMFSGHGARAAGSYAFGLALTVGAFEFGAYNVRFTARFYPGLTLAAAVGSYLMTVVALGLVYALSSPKVIDGLAMGIGIFCGVAVWIGTELERARVRSEHA
jgi:hypothetical protein